MAESPSEYFDLIRYYLGHEDERSELALRQRQYVLKHHTYFNRLISIFAAFGMLEECIRIQHIIDSL